MSGTTTARVTGLTAESTALPTGGTVKLRWAVYSGADDYRVDAALNGGAWQSWGRTGGAITTFSKGGAGDGEWRVKITARRAGSDIAGSTSDALAVRIGPVPAPTPAPAPAPTPAPSTPAYATAAELAALRDRVAALEAAVKAQAAATIQASGTLALAVQGQAQEVPATATMTLTPVAATK